MLISVHIVLEAFCLIYISSLRAILCRRVVQSLRRLQSRPVFFQDTFDDIGCIECTWSIVGCFSLKAALNRQVNIIIPFLGRCFKISAVIKSNSDASFGFRLVLISSATSLGVTVVIFCLKHTRDSPPLFFWLNFSNNTLEFCIQFRNCLQFVSIERGLYKTPIGKNCMASGNMSRKILP